MQIISFIFSILTGNKDQGFEECLSVNYKKLNRPYTTFLEVVGGEALLDLQI